MDLLFTSFLSLLLLLFPSVPYRFRKNNWLDDDDERISDLSLRGRSRIIPDVFLFFFFYSSGFSVIPANTFLVDDRTTLLYTTALDHSRAHNTYCSSHSGDFYPSTISTPFVSEAIIPFHVPFLQLNDYLRYSLRSDDISRPNPPTPHPRNINDKTVS